MKRELNPASRWPLNLYRIVVALVLTLIILLIAGTIYGLVRSRDAAPLIRIGGSIATGEASSPAASANIFTGIGRLRIPLRPSAAGSGGTLILSIAFPYPDDQPFIEELAAKIGDFRSIAAAYFSALPAEKLVNLDEAAAKIELLKRYNANLRLGKIETLYFNDLMIIE
jgi:flagellar basal body-associated protein FliL